MADLITVHTTKAGPFDMEPIKARLAAATQGRWVWCDHGGAPEDAGSIFGGDGTPREWSGRYSIEAEQPEPDEAEWEDKEEYAVMVLGPVLDEADPSDVYELPINDADAALIINAPSDLAALVAEVERLRAIVAQITGGAIK